MIKKYPTWEEQRKADSERRAEWAKLEREALRLYKLKMLFRATLMSFAWAGVFHFVVGGWVGVIFVSISTLMLLYGVCMPQVLFSGGPGRIRTLLALKAFAFGALFGILFLAWPYIIALMAAIAALTVVCVNLGQRKSFDV